MYDYEIAYGRLVGLKRMMIVDTYAGMYEGTMESASRYIRGELTERAARLLPPAKPIYVVDPGGAELPQWMVVAEFESSDGVHGDDADVCSRLTVCWFLENMSRRIDDMIWIVLKKVDWEKYAEDFDLF